MLKIRTILVPTDYSQASQHVIPFACALARDYQAKLILLHVVEPPVMVYDGIQPEPLNFDAEQKIIQDAADKLRETQRGVEVESTLKVGLPVDEILKSAVETKADLIVMGTHGR